MARTSKWVLVAAVLVPLALLASLSLRSGVARSGAPVARTESSGAGAPDVGGIGLAETRPRGSAVGTAAPESVHARMNAGADPGPTPTGTTLPVEAFVRDGDGPRAGLRISATRRDDSEVQIVSSITESSGVASLRLSPGTWDVTLKLPLERDFIESVSLATHRREGSQRVSQASSTVTLLPGLHSRVEWELRRRAQIVARLSGGGDFGSREALLYVRRSVPGGSADSLRISPSVTGDEVRFTPLDPGVYVVGPKSPHVAYFAPIPVTLAAGDERVVPVLLHRSPKATLQIVARSPSTGEESTTSWSYTIEPSDVPIPGVEPASGNTDPVGRMTYTAPPGRYRLTLARPRTTGSRALTDGETWVQGVALRADGTFDPSRLTVDVEPPGEIVELHGTLVEKPRRRRRRYALRYLERGGGVSVVPIRTPDGIHFRATFALDELKGTTVELVPAARPDGAALGSVDLTPPRVDWTVDLTDSR